MHIIEQRVIVPINVNLQVCPNVCSRSWSSSRSSFTRNFPQSDKSKSYGNLHVGALGKNVELITAFCHGYFGLEAQFFWLKVLG